MQPTLIGWMFACAVAVAAAGCHAPWSSKSVDGADPLTVAADRSVAAQTTALTTGAEPDISHLLAQLQQVGDVDPAAQQRLIRELRRTKPELWPLVTQQFKATLAYHEQLNSKRSLREEDDAEEAAVRPSIEIGGLVDPREEKRGRESFATGNLDQWQYSPVAKDSRPLLPGADSASPPAQFQTNEPASPIDDLNRARLAFNAAQRTAGDEDKPPQTVLQASFEGADVADSVQPMVLTPNQESIRGRESLSTGNHCHLERCPVDKDSRPHLSTEPHGWKELIAQAADNLSDRVAASPQSTAEVHQHVTLRTLRLLTGQTEEALEPIPGISPIEQDYWSRQLFALATYLDHHKQPDEKRRAAASVTHLDEAVAKLRELGSLSLRNLTFCKTVYDFGAYESFPDDEFSPGEQVSIYVEVENYRSVSTEKGYRTLLGGTYEIVDHADQRVAGGEFPDVEDNCRSQRRDFHIEYGLTLPANLSAGAYRLRLVVKDRQGDKLGSAELAFDVVAAR